MSDDTKAPEVWLWEQIAALLPADELARLQTGYKERNRVVNRFYEARTRRGWLAGAEKQLGIAQRRGDAASAARYAKSVKRHRDWLNKYKFSEKEDGNHGNQADPDRAE